MDTKHLKNNMPPTPVTETPKEATKPKYATDTDVDKFKLCLEQQFVKIKDSPEGFVYVPTNLQPEFHGATEFETLMKFYVVKFEAKGGKTTSAVADQRDPEHARYIYCEEFLSLYKRASQ